MHAISLCDFLTFIAQPVGQSLDYALHWINHYVFSAAIAKFYVVNMSPLDSNLQLRHCLVPSPGCERRRVVYRASDPAK